MQNKIYQNVVYFIFPVRFVFFLLALFSPAFLAACSPFNTEFSPVLPENMPVEYATGADSPPASGVEPLYGYGQAVPAQAMPLGDNLPGNTGLVAPAPALVPSWWESFNSPNLDSLIRAALAGNFDIRTAYARLQQAEAVAKKSGASLWPSLSYSARASESRGESQKQEADPSRFSQSETYTGSLAASFEIDIWGRLSSLKQADLLAYKATEEDAQSAALTISATVAELWVDILTNRAEQAIVERQLELNTTVFSLQEVRLVNGQAGALDVLQQQQQILRTQNELPLLKMEEQLLLQRLALLLGKASLPPAFIPAQSALPALPPLPDVGLPVDLLANRPDIRAARYRLLGADAALKASKANLLPSLNLSASAAYGPAALNLLFANWTTSLVAALAGPIFDAGGRAADVARSRALAEERSVAYTKIVAEAYTEVYNALVSEKARTEYLASMEKQLALAQFAEKESLSRYLAGKTQFLVYLTEVQNLQSLERNVLLQRAALLKQRIALHRVLGGAKLP